MPIYDFHCRHCDRSFELLIGLSEKPACPECGSEDMQKLVSLPAPQGKTSGILSSARSQAAREGHFSHYERSERRRGK
ncbi:MAG: zinc ribbon domain-containing protein [Gammaproteobacteria bacterium]|nr:zinc ribbon domain-containing protein [Gammaproteobacteria bacterium]